MAGLIVIGIAVIWLVLAAKIASLVAARFQMLWAAILAGVATFLILAIVPFADEIVGRWQFKRLCASEAKVWVHPDAQKVLAAQDRSSFRERDGFIFPVREQIEEFVDIATDQPFLKVSAFHTPGGLLMRTGLNMGSSTSCWPDRWSEPYKALKLDDLLKRGKK